jgi:hypothetical protein
MQTAYQHVHEPPPRLPLEFAFAQPLLDRMLAKKPEDRFPDMKSFGRVLRNVLLGSPVLQRRLQIEPGENLSEKLRAMGFSESLMQGRASSVMPGTGEVPAGALKHTLLERSDLALEPVEERRSAPRQEAKKPVRWPFYVIFVLACLAAAGYLLSK